MKRLICNQLFLLVVIMTGEMLIHISCKKEKIEHGTVTDIDGNSYITVKISNQWWMAENLKTTKYNDGTLIPKVEDSITWKGLTNGAYCWYDNNILYKNDYGALYNWHAINTSALCPIGWHVPSYEEWRTLITFLGGIEVASGKLKETGTNHWLSPNKGATNETGFTALPGGFRHPLGPFLEIGSIGSWWYSTESSPYHAWSTSITYNSTFFYEDKNCEYSWGFSVRCIKDL